jgi:GTP-binding protein
MAETNFIDQIRIHLKSGRGGPGSRHFFRDKLNAKGGPDGGDGGKGGDIVVRGNTQLWTLLHLRYRKHVIAESGMNGSGGGKTGKSGENIYIEVPLGTIVKNEEDGSLIGEITENNQTLTILSGGRGGLGNRHFKSSTKQNPMYAQPGEEGSEGWFVFELKVLADVGLVGFPNAGKSTLISTISAAKPEVADYPFTTITPHLGVVEYKDYKSFIMADIPGIIEGASEGKGLGLRFLRHIERNAVLLFIIPANEESLKTQYDILLNELRQFNPELLVKNRIIGISKTDLLLEEELKEKLEEFKGIDIPLVAFSSHQQTNIDSLKDIIWKELQKVNPIS